MSKDSSCVGCPGVDGPNLRCLLRIGGYAVRVPLTRVAQKAPIITPKSQTGHNSPFKIRFPIVCDTVDTPFRSLYRSSGHVHNIPLRGDC